MDGKVFHMPCSPMADDACMTTKSINTKTGAYESSGRCVDCAVYPCTAGTKTLTYPEFDAVYEETTCFTSDCNKIDASRKSTLSCNTVSTNGAVSSFPCPATAEDACQTVKYTDTLTGAFESCGMCVECGHHFEPNCTAGTKTTTLPVPGFSNFTIETTTCFGNNCNSFDCAGPTALSAELRGSPVNILPSRSELAICAILPEASAAVHSEASATYTQSHLRSPFYPRAEIVA